MVYHSGNDVVSISQRHLLPCASHAPDDFFRGGIVDDCPTFFAHSVAMIRSNTCSLLSVAISCTVIISSNKIRKYCCLQVIESMRNEKAIASYNALFVGLSNAYEKNSIDFLVIMICARCTTLSLSPPCIDGNTEVQRSHGVPHFGRDVQYITRIQLSR